MPRPFKDTRPKVGAWQQVWRMSLRVVGYFLIIQRRVGFTDPEIKVSEFCATVNRYLLEKTTSLRAGTV
jgi:hypothetical protein